MLHILKEILERLTPVFLCAGLGGLWGIAEGMTMVQFTDPRWKLRTNWEWGIRSHEWFRKYHLIDSAVVGLAAVIGWWIAKTYGNASLQFSWWIFAGAVCAGWEMKEAGYSFARWGTIVAKSEHLNWFDFWDRYLSRIWSCVMHWGRAIAAIILIVKGFVK